MKLLVIKTEYYFDGHGEGEGGGVEKFITDNTLYKFIDPNAYYHSDPIDDLEYAISLKEVSKGDEKKWLKENCEMSELYAQDGYNCTACAYTIREITDDQATRFEEIIEEYDKIQ